MRNENIRMGCFLICKLSERVDQSVIRLYGYMEKMSEKRQVKRIYRAEVDGKRARG